jgi:menaquinone-specific isochorismate synthase
MKQHSNSKRLACVTRPLTADEAAGWDPFSWVGEAGFLYASPAMVLAGRGVAAELSLPSGLASEAGREQLSAFLADIESDDPVGLPGSGPVAGGALPFDPGAPCALDVFEEVVVRRSDGFAWTSAVFPAGGGLEPSVVLEGPVSDSYRAPDSFSLVPEPSHFDWLRKVAEAVEAISAGQLDKIVLSRQVVVEANRPLVVPDLLERLARLYPSCVVFFHRGFLGASPELLVERSGRSVRSFPLAGTVAHSGDPVSDRKAVAEMLGSAKQRLEHELAASAVAERIRPLCKSVSLPKTPEVVSLRNVSHLGTEVRGHLAADRSGRKVPSALDLAARLHPTPAVSGVPLEESLNWIAKLEVAPRGRYAGPVGWMDARGDGEWMVAIRSAEVQGSTARLYAGAGVMGDSSPAEELAETQLKLQALLAAVVRP